MISLKKRRALDTDFLLDITGQTSDNFGVVTGTTQLCSWLPISLRTRFYKFGMGTGTARPYSWLPISLRTRLLTTLVWGLALLSSTVDYQFL